MVRGRIMPPLWWTKTTPVQPGWYWWLYEKGRPKTVLRIVDLYGGLKVASSNLDVAFQGGEWAGPISEHLLEVEE